MRANARVLPIGCLVLCGAMMGLTAGVGADPPYKRGSVASDHGRAPPSRPLPAGPAGEGVRWLEFAGQQRPLDPCRLVRQVKEFGG